VVIAIGVWAMQRDVLARGARATMVGRMVAGMWAVLSLEKKKTSERMLVLLRNHWGSVNKRSSE
jgi:hypothetical protein